MKATVFNLGLTILFFFAFATTVHSQENKKEKKSKIQKEFANFDQDGDKIISIEEFKEKRAKKRKEKFSEAELKEFYVRVEKNFSLYDTDEDGGITWEEFKNRKAKVRNSK